MPEKSIRMEHDHRIRTLEKEVAKSRETAKRLSYAKQRQAAIIEFLPDATFAVDVHGKVIAWNRAMESLCGLKAGEMLGRGDLAYSVPFHGSKRPMLIDLVLNWDEQIASEGPTVQKDGEILISETHNPPFSKKPCVLWHRAQPLFDRSGTVIGAVEVIRDITAWRQAEENLKNREELLRICVDNTPATVVLCDKDMRWLAYSRRCLEDYRLAPT